MIRLATTLDAADIAAIWNPVIRDSIATFNAQEHSTEAISQMVSERAATGHATFVALLHNKVAGFATYSQFRGGVGYKHTAEHTVIVAPRAAGTGLGRGLMEALCAHAAGAGIHSLWAGISGENTNGVAFHERLGFVHVATLPEVGRKFDRWFDLILMQKRL